VLQGRVVGVDEGNIRYTVEVRGPWPACAAACTEEERAADVLEAQLN
jgi:hypothetical protein